MSMSWPVDFPDALPFIEDKREWKLLKERPHYQKAKTAKSFQSAMKVVKHFANSNVVNYIKNLRSRYDGLVLLPARSLEGNVKNALPTALAVYLNKKTGVPIDLLKQCSILG
jgi:hypothetical protein